MAEFSVGGQNYKSSKLDVFKQFDIAKRLAPVMSAVAEIARAGDVEVEELVVKIAPVISALPDADTHYIFNSCLDVTQRQQGDRWARVRAPGSGGLMFQDIGLPELMQITFNVLKEHFAGFFAVLPVDPVGNEGSPKA